MAFHPPSRAVDRAAWITVEGARTHNAIYVFDEPSTGLHPHDVRRLLDLLARLRDAHSTVLVVEHHPDVIASADHVVDLGPAGGDAGGRIVFEGAPSALRAADTPTARVLRAPVRHRERRRTPRGAILDDVRTPCEACSGRRFNPTALAATVRGRSIADVLEMRPAAAADLLAEHRDIAARLLWLDRVGLGYVAIGQSIDTLSGGERQRLLLARHLAEAHDPARLRIVLDEPTAGLHGADVGRLLGLFDELVDAGAPLIAIEHRLRVFAHADHVVDLGPGAGRDGGTVVFAGPPPRLVDDETSVTGRHLARALARAA